MRNRSLLLGLVLLFGAIGCGSADQAQLQGTWVVKAAEIDGKQNPVVVGMTLIFDGDSVTFQESDFHLNLERRAHGPNIQREELKGTFRLDPGRDPREIDFWLTKMADVKDGKKPEEAKSYGIYKIEDDTLYLCIASVETLRPLKFSSKPQERIDQPNQSITLLIARRPPEKK